MHCGGIQRFLAAGNSQKTGALLEGFRSQLRHLQEFLPVPEPAVGLPVFHDVGRNGAGDSGHVFQQGRGSGIQIHAHPVYAVFHHGVQGFPQLLLVHIMLVLTHADGFRIYFYQLRQRILKTAGDGCGTALAHIQVRIFFRGQLTGGVDGGSRLVDDDVPEFFALCLCVLLDKINDNLLGFPGCGSVAHGDHIDVVLLHQLCQHGLGFPHLVLGRRWENHRGVQDFARRVAHRQLASGTERRIPAQYGFARQRRLHQKLLQVASENLNGPFLGFLGELVPKLRLNGRGNQPLVGIRQSRRQVVPSPHLLLQVLHAGFLRRLNVHGQHLLLLSPVHSQHPVSRNLCDSLGIVRIVGIDRIIHTFFCGHGNHHALLLGAVSNLSPILRVVGNVPGDDILRVPNRLRHGVHFFFRVQILLRFRFHVCRRSVLPNKIRQSADAFLLRNGGSGAALRFVRPVQVLHGHRGLRRLNLLPQRRGHLLLLLNGRNHRRLPLLQIPQVLQPLVKRPQLLVVHPAGHVLPVPRNERNRVPLID